MADTTFEQMTRMRDNLDGLGYAMGPRGLFGIGNEQNTFDPVALGGGAVDSTISMRRIKVLDAYTKASIYQFQRDQGLAATGQIGADLIAKVELSVRNVQNNLKIVLAKNDTDLLSGYFGLKTFTYVKEYQKLRGFPITGIAIPAVQKALSDEARKLVGGSPAPGGSQPPMPNDPQGRLTKLSDLKGLYDRGSISKDGLIEEFRRLVP
jgi:hypothetical protein